MGAQKSHSLCCMLPKAGTGTAQGAARQPRPSPESVGEGYKGQSNHVVEQHDNGVLAPRVHVGSGIDGVPIEAALQQVGDSDVCGHIHALLPV